MQDNGLQQPPRNRPPRVRSTDYDANLTAMLQEQQHILHQVLDTQKKMQKKPEEFEAKLNEFARRSEVSSSSPDVNVRKKCKVTRDLTVS